MRALLHPHQGLIVNQISPNVVTCTLRRLVSSALSSAVASTRGAFMKRNLVVDIRSDPNGLLIPMEILLRTIFTMRVSSRRLRIDEGSKQAWGG